MRLSTRLGSGALLTFAYVATLAGAAFGFATIAYGSRVFSDRQPLAGEDWLWALVSLLVTVAAFWGRSRALGKYRTIRDSDTSGLVRK